MMPRRERLRRKKDISAILSQSRRASGDSLMVRLRRTGLNRVRSTVVVGTVVSKRAVVRNRAKRQLRHILKEVLNQAENGAVGNDLMLTIKKPFLTTERPARLNTVVELLTKTGLKFKK